MSLVNKNRKTSMWTYDKWDITDQISFYNQWYFKCFLSEIVHVAKNFFLSSTRNLFIYFSFSLTIFFSIVENSCFTEHWEISYRFIIKLLSLENGLSLTHNITPRSSSRLPFTISSRTFHSFYFAHPLTLLAFPVFLFLFLFNLISGLFTDV
mgnify:CR=1 FL=1